MVANPGRGVCVPDDLDHREVLRWAVRQRVPLVPQGGNTGMVAGATPPDDGSAVITKHPGTGGAVTVGTVTAQLLYEIAGPLYAGPDVVSDDDEPGDWSPLEA